MNTSFLKLIFGKAAMTRYCQDVANESGFSPVPKASYV